MDFFTNMLFTTGSVKAPRKAVVGTEARFLAQQPVTLVLKEHVLSYSGDDFSIKDLNGVSYFQCKGKYISLHDRKCIYDIYNNPIITVKEKISIKFKQTLIDPKSKQKIANIKKPLFYHKTLIVKFFNKTTNKKEVITVRNDLMALSSGIYYDNVMIGRIIKKFDVKTLFTNKDSYLLEIAPNVDMALMVALAIIFDEFKYD
ncbi:hypothetical protein BCR36DRAFT_582749 [Piromyces finnis]|uniref:DUF567-domain-containing protein n=1 Tax=Piromyces finnis TaxID=1754191 RepID=A0A1Y1VCR5_9FUNG|nr:hypothetical protein BCR36DRAFT_582749 [Piromyces finnis]|eukprot:ORX52252.1 hypothetical protein BCR36DRAFT_582749 [Piromyces finnis]